jgi:acyl-phosphate glycerol 3-phosphate acyltransferase
MSLPIADIILVAAAYLIGAIPFGYLVARSLGVDILRQGSGNIGATNVGRILGKKFGFLVFALDLLKGAIPTAAGSYFGQGTGSTLAVAMGLAAILGHLFPVYLRFRGGKGVATGAGVAGVLVPIPTLAALLAWAAALCATRYVSFSSLTAALVLCATQLLLAARPGQQSDPILTGFCLAAFVLVVVRHRANMSRLLEGTENRVRWSGGFLGLTKSIHVLSLGLWFGGMIFFTLAALSLFHTFEAMGESPPDVRPSWLALPADFDREQGTRLAGIAVAPWFDWYFAIQGACALLALASAMGWDDLDQERAQRLRLRILMAALALVLIGWPVARYVGKLRIDRYASDQAIADSARAAFGNWHAASLALNMATLVLVTLALALAAQMPAEVPSQLPANKPAG